MQAAAITASTERAPGYLWAGSIVVFAAVWLVLMSHLRVEWSVNPQYNYGWGVPALAAYLFLRRWDDRPEPAPGAMRFLPLALFLAAAALLLPANLFLEANPDWRLIDWLFALLAATLTYFAIWFAGGRPWLRHFAVPLGFLLIAVPWPSGLENALIQNLMRWVAGLTVEVLNFLGIIANQRGNLIELSTGIVGINEACSGVRSFQSTLMISIFLGELYRFRWGRRLVLLAAGVALAFGLNVVRSFFLTWMCVRGGTNSINAWHDPAGYLVFGFSFAGLLGICLWLRGKQVEPSATVAPPSASPRPWPVKWLAVLAAWILFVGLGTELWYRIHERNARPSASWAIAWPDRAPQFKSQPIAEETRRILRYSDGAAASWNETDGAQWLGFFFRWAPGRGSAQLARSHTPEVCMPASGLKLAADHGMSLIPVDQLQIPFRAYTFTKGAQSVYIFFCVWEDQQTGDTPDLSRQRATPLNRTRAVLEGRRHLGQQVFQVVLAGPPDIEAARRQFAATLQRLIRPAPARS